MEIAVIPPVMPGESVLGYIMRLAIISADKELNPLARKLFDLPHVGTPLILPSNLERMSIQLACVFSTAAELIEKHTVFPIFRPFIEKSKADAIEGHLLKGLKVKGVFGCLGLGGNRGRAEKCLGICTKCVQDDILACGFAYWHREHQVPNISICLTHHSKLMMGCGECKYSLGLNKIALLPGLTCWCGRNLRLRSPSWKSRNAENSELRVAKLISTLLSSESIIENGELIGDLYSARVCELGYVHGSLRSISRLRRDFEQHFSLEFLNRFGSMKNGSSNWLSRAAAGDAPRNFMLNIILIDFLFGSIEVFFKELSAMSLLLPKTPSKVKSKLAGRQGLQESFDERRTRLRNKLISYIERNPQATRTDASKAIGACVQWLLAYDRSWYEEVVPAKGKAITLINARNKRSKIFNEQFDKSAAEYVRARFESLINSKDRPIKITKSRLIQGFTRANLITGITVDLPITQRLLEQLCETTFMFKQRLVRWILQNPTEVPPQRNLLSYVKRITRLDPDVVYRIYNDFIENRV